jgi:hypothetical protein
MATRESEVKHMISAEEKRQDCLLLTESVERAPKPIVVVLSWHRAYGEALLYAQSDSAATLISSSNGIWKWPLPHPHFHPKKAETCGTQSRHYLS